MMVIIMITIMIIIKMVMMFSAYRGVPVLRSLCVRLNLHRDRTRSLCRHIRLG